MLRSRVYEDLGIGFRVRGIVWRVAKMKDRSRQNWDGNNHRAGWDSTGRLCVSGLVLSSTHKPLGSSFLGLPYRILNIHHKKELRRSLCEAGCRCVISYRRIGLSKAATLSRLERPKHGVVGQGMLLPSNRAG